MVAMFSQTRAAPGVGIATTIMAACGCLAIPSLFELCNVGAVSGPLFVVATLALATTLGGGLCALLSRRSRGRLFVVSAMLFTVCIVSSISIMRAIPLQIAVLGSIIGTLFALTRWLSTGLGGQSN
jgi:hypothetical protein